MILWSNLKHPLSLCCVSSRLGSLAIGICGVIFTAFAGFTRHYGVTNFDSLLSFELVFDSFNTTKYIVNTTETNHTTVNRTDMFSNPTDPNIHHFFMVLSPFYQAVYPTFLLYLCLSSMCLIYGAWRMSQCCLVIWLAVKALDLFVNISGTTLFYLCYQFKDRYLTSLGLMSFFLLLKGFTVWVVVDYYILLSNLKSLSVDAILELSPPVK